MTILSATVLLLLVMDPLGNVPMFLVALRDVPDARHRRVVTREMCIALGVMLLFLFGGRFILELFNISGHTLGIAGGILLFLIAMRMVFPSTGSMFGPQPAGEPFIIPLAIPLIAGPSTLITLILLMTREPGRWPEWLLAMMLAWVISAIILLCSDPLSRLLRQRGLIALERLMGLILTAVAVEMFMRGIEQAVQEFRTLHPG